MQQVVTERRNCRLCNAAGLQQVLSVGPSPSGDAYVASAYLAREQEIFPLDLFLCPACGAVQLGSVVDPQVLYGEYIYETSISLGLAQHFSAYVDDVLACVSPPQGALVVDVGSNDGTLLSAFKQRGMRVLGVDPAPRAVEKARAAGIDTIQGFFNVSVAEKIKEDYGPAVIVAANNVFANIDNLDEIVAGLDCLLAVGGVFVFETGYLVDLVEKAIIDNIYHEHISYFAVTSLVKFFAKYHMELICVQRVDTKGGSIRGIVQRKGGSRPIDSSVGEFVAMEKTLGVGTPGFFTKINAQISAVKLQLTRLLHNLQSRGKTIAAYGASVGVTTLIYFFGLADYLSFIVDDNPSRYNLFSPGHHIPVFSSSAIYEKDPDYVVILAWRYRAPIMEKHKAYLSGGGHFIVPLPQIEVI